MAERRLKLLLEWFELHPERYVAVKRKITGLNVQYAKVQKSLMPLTKTAAQEKAMTEAVAETRAKEALQLTRKRKNLKRLANALKQYQKNLIKTRTGLELWSRKLVRAGWRVGFFGWIVSYGARSMLRIFGQLFEALKKLIAVSVEWPSSLEKVFTAMALLESQGMLTADMQDLLYGTIDRLLTQGPAFQALWLGLESVFISAATIIISQLIPHLQELLGWLTAYLTRRDVQVMLAELGVTLFDLIRALITALPAVVAVLKAFDQWMPVITYLIRSFAPFLPLLFVLGTIVWMLGPAFTVVGYALKIVTVWQNLSAVAAGKQVVGYTMAAYTAKLLQVAILGVIGGLMILAGSFLLVKQLSVDWGKWFKKMETTTKKSMKGINLTIDQNMAGNYAVSKETLEEMAAAAEENFESMEFVTEDALMGISYDLGLMGTAASGLATDMGDAVTSIEQTFEDLEDSMGDLEDAMEDFGIGWEDTWKFMAETSVIQIGLAVGAFNPLAGALIILIGTLIIFKDEIAGALTQLREWAAGLGAVAAGPVGDFQTQLENLGKTIWNAVTPALAAVNDALYNAGINLETVGGFIDWLKECFEKAIEPLEGFTKALQDMMGPLSDLLEKGGDVLDWLFSLCFRHAAEGVDVFSNALQQSRGEMDKTISDLSILRRGLMSPFTAEMARIGEGTFGGAGPQYITVEAPVTFGSISIYGVEELSDFFDLVQENVTTGIANAFARKRR